jgi:hypothetical protein
MTRLLTDNALMPEPDLSLAARTLLAGGFILDTAEPKPGYAVLVVHRLDEFGLAHRYCFAIAEEEIGQSEIEGASIAAEHYQADLIVVGECDAEVASLGWDRFVNLFGGPVFGLSPLESQFREQLGELAHNQLPEGLEGEPNTLFEEYVRSALEFIIGSRVVPYGQKRRGEARPDGIIPPNRGLYALYDAKAYSKGYKVTIDTLRQFESYVKEFEDRYEGYLPRLNAFIAVSGHFPHRDKTLEDRSRDLYELCGVPLSFLTADTLSQIIEILSDKPSIRRAIRWTRVFADPIVRSQRVEQERRTVLQDDAIG